MKRKTLLALLTVAIAIPVLALTVTGYDAERADELGRQFAAENPGAVIHTSILEEDITEKEEIRRTELIVVGIVSEVETYWKQYEDDKFPMIVIRYTVTVEDTIKGNSSVKSVPIIVLGGSLDGVTHTTEATSLAVGDKVLLLLGKDKSSIFGNDYGPVSMSKSIYVVVGNQATNSHDERSGPLDSVIERITSKIKS